MLNLNPRLPFAMESLEIVSPLHNLRCMPGYVTTGGSAPSDKVQKLDIDLCDEQGQCLCKNARILL